MSDQPKPRPGEDAEALARTVEAAASVYRSSGVAALLPVAEAHDIIATRVRQLARPGGLSEEEVSTIEAAVGPMRVLMLECAAVGNAAGAVKTAEEVEILRAIVAKLKGGPR